MTKELVFKHAWLSPGKEHQETILNGLNISNPEDSGVEELIFKKPGITTIISNDHSKIWSLAFARLMAEHFGLPSEGYAVTTEMEIMSNHCFMGLTFHHGFVSAFKVGSIVHITYKKENN